MRILITNDDGIHSRGLWSLAKALNKIGHVSIVAPDRDLSGIGTAMTLSSIVRTHEILPTVDGIEARSVQGTPADCVILATEFLFNEPFDLIVSGINQGANLGLDVLSSGTIGAALQGYYLNIPSIAISAAYTNDTEIRYEAASRTAVILTRWLSSNLPKEPLLLNVNLPAAELDSIEHVEITHLGPRAYLESVERGQDGRRIHYWIKHNKPQIEDAEIGTDVWAVRNNRVSITPIDVSLIGKAQPRSLQGVAKAVSMALSSR